MDNSVHSNNSSSSQRARSHLHHRSRRSSSAGSTSRVSALAALAPSRAKAQGRAVRELHPRSLRALAMLVASGGIRSATVAARVSWRSNRTMRPRCTLRPLVVLHRACLRTSSSRVGCSTVRRRCQRHRAQLPPQRKLRKTDPFKQS
jgi:predicted oxidoreductase